MLGLFCIPGACVSQSAAPNGSVQQKVFAVAEGLWAHPLTFAATTPFEWKVFEVMGSSASSSCAQDRQEESVHQSCISCGISPGAGNNLPQTTPNHQTSIDYTYHAKNQEPKHQSSSAYIFY